TIALVEIATGELRPRTLCTRLRNLSALWGGLLMLAVAVPWHVTAGQRNPGFLWDYVVNQHLLFFFDQKLPRDSIPDSLSFFWTIFFARGLPWSLLLPAALVHAWRTVRTPCRLGPKPFLPLLWLIAVLSFFSLAVSRLEHYCLPALPAMALLVGALLADILAEHSLISRGALASLPAVGAFLAFVVTLYDPARLLTAIDPTLPGYNLETLMRPAILTLSVGLLGLTLLLVSRYNRMAFAVGVTTAIALLPFVQIAHERVEPLFSWRPFARLIREAAPDAGRVFFRAEDEYQ